jgi:hypothetical protein
MADYAPEDMEFLRQLVRETNALPQHAMPGFFSRIVNHPGAMAYQTKSEDQYDQDMRRAHFLEKINERFPHGAAGHLPYEVVGPAIDYKYGKMPDLKSPYQRGLLTPGSHLSNVMNGMAALPSAAYSLSGVLANSVDPEAPWDPQAEKRLARAVNTLTMYGAEDFGLVPKGTGTFADELPEQRRQKEQVSWQTLDPSSDYAAIDEATHKKQWEGTRTGFDHYTDLGASPGLATALGFFSDAALDPVNNLTHAAILARAGKIAPAWKKVGWDVAFPTAGVALERAPAIMRGLDKAGARLRELMGNPDLQSKTYAGE